MPKRFSAFGTKIIFSTKPFGILIKKEGEGACRARAVHPQRPPCNAPQACRRARARTPQEPRKRAGAHAQRPVFAPCLSGAALNPSRWRTCSAGKPHTRKCTPPASTRRPPKPFFFFRFGVAKLSQISNNMPVDRVTLKNPPTLTIPGKS